ncbi:MAG: glycosyl transferase [Geminocystis sp.]|nr:glycosyl transferase [Geminocystis sp.]
MSRPVLYLAITNHGFGHAVRMASVANRIKQINPDILLIIATTAPRWLLEAYIQGDFIHRSRAFDVGVIQSDSLTMDLDSTLARLREYQQKEKTIVTQEVEFVRLNKVSLIVADIPAMVAEVASLANIPCWMVGNFGWDFIYRSWGGEFTAIADRLASHYHKVDRLFRLPMAEEMQTFPVKEDVGLIGSQPRYPQEEIRTRFNLTRDKEKTVLLTFGGLGLEAIPYHNLSLFPDWQFITFDKNAPPLPNLLKVTDKTLRPVDFMPLCGKVVCKPGFSTFAESMCLDVPIISLTRDGFAEAHILLEGLRQYSYHRIIQWQEFFHGNWDFLKKDVLPPLSNKKIDKQGADYIAREIALFLASP